MAIMNGKAAITKISFTKKTHTEFFSRKAVTKGELKFLGLGHSIEKNFEDYFDDEMTIQ